MVWSIYNGVYPHIWSFLTVFSNSELRHYFLNRQKESLFLHCNLNSSLITYCTFTFLYEPKWKRVSEQNPAVSNCASAVLRYFNLIWKHCLRVVCSLSCACVPYCLLPWLRLQECPCGLRSLRLTSSEWKIGPSPCFQTPFECSTLREGGTVLGAVSFLHMWPAHGKH